jgi:uncharacterized protein (TIGR03032 family)
MEEKSAIQPFNLRFSPQLPDLLHGLQCSLAISTYQANKLVFISPGDNRFTVLPRNFAKPMGFEISARHLLLATRDEVIYFENSPELADTYPGKQGVYDALYLPRSTFYTGQSDIHDIALGKDGIWGVNTSFSCLCQISGNFNFIPRWQPPFITKLAFEDRCHLNSLALENGQPKYVTALGATNTARGWRENITNGGILMDVTTNDTILSGLAMPHSLKYYNNELYFLQSASGDVCKVNTENGTWESIRKLDCFCRGLDIYKDYMFIGMSRLRKNSSTFAKLPFAETADKSGIIILHLPTQSIVGQMVFETSVDEIYDVRVLPDMLRPNVLNTINPLHKYSLSIPGATFWANPEDVAKSDQT